MNAEFKIPEPESVQRFKAEQSSRQIELEHTKRIHSAWDEVRDFKSDGKPDAKFYDEWASRFLKLGRFLRSEKLADHLNELRSHAESEMLRDAFDFGVAIYRAAVAGNHTEVRKRLKTVADYPPEFSGPVGNAIRRDVMELLLVAKWPERFSFENVHTFRAIEKPQSPPVEVTEAEPDGNNLVVRADPPKNSPVAFLDDIDDQDLFCEIERENLKPKDERRSMNAIARARFPDEWEARLKRIQRAKKKSRETCADT